MILFYLSILNSLVFLCKWYHIFMNFYSLLHNSIFLLTPKVIKLINTVHGNLYIKAWRDSIFNCSLTQLNFLGSAEENLDNQQLEVRITQNWWLLIQNSDSVGCDHRADATGERYWKFIGNSLNWWTCRIARII